MGEAANLEALKEGLLRLRKGSLYIIIGFIVLLVGSAITAIAALSLVTSGHFTGHMHGGGLGKLASLITIMAPAGLVIIVGSILELVAWLKWREAGKTLSEYDPRLGIGSTGALLVLIGFIIAVIGGLLMLASMVSPTLLFISITVTVIGGLAVLVGGVLFSIMLVRLGDQSSTLKIAGVLMLISSIAYLLNAGLGSLLFIVSAILVYIGAGDALQRLTTS